MSILYSDSIMSSSNSSLSVNQNTNRQQYFHGMLKERQLFPTPWYWCVHGLGLGQEPTGFDPQKSQNLLNISLALSEKTQQDYHRFTHCLLQGIVSTCETISLDNEQQKQQVNSHFLEAIKELPQDPWEYVRACVLLTETLVKLEQLELYKNSVYEHLEKAFQVWAEITADNDKFRYEKLQLFANLLIAVGQAEFWELLTLQQNNQLTYIETALQASTEISDLFYFGRGSAIVFTALGIIGFGEKVYGDSCNYLQNLLDIFDLELKEPSNRDSDGVHSGSDYYIFPLSLILNSLAVLNRSDYLTYKRDWVEVSLSFFHSLSPASQTSQITFLLFALNNLNLLDTYIPDVIGLFNQCMENYLQCTDGFQTDDYLRCTYLIHLSEQLMPSEPVDSRVVSMLFNGVSQTLGSKRYLESNYGSSYMAIAYGLSALDKINRWDLLLSEELGLLKKFGQLEDDPKTTRLNALRTAFALVEVGLRMRPLDSKDTSLFS